MTASAVGADVNALNALAQAALIAVFRLDNPEPSAIDTAGVGEPHILGTGLKFHSVRSCDFRKLLR